MSAFPSCFEPSPSLRTAVAELPTDQDFLPLKGTDHVEFYVGNARQAAYFYRAAFGMSLVAYAGPETGQRDRASYVVQQGKIRFVLTTPLRSRHPIAEHIHRHGDGVHAIALWVDDARHAWHETTSRGAVSVAEPHSSLGRARHSGPGQHSHLRRHDSHLCGARRLLGPVSARLSRRRRRPGRAPCRPAAHRSHGGQRGLARDERVGRTSTRDVMGFSLYQHFDDKDISTEYSALMSKVMANGNGYVKFPINEPAEGKKKSQIEEYLDFYPGPGVQHIALATNDILHTVNKLHEQGIEFPARAAHLLHRVAGPRGQDR